MATIRILLTFDDGPSASGTNRILDALASTHCAAFFIQTHAHQTKYKTFRDCKSYKLTGKTFTRGKHPDGAKAVKRAHVADHVIAIHTGSDFDHYPHPCRVNEPPDYFPPIASPPKNGLQTDMMRAKEEIENITGGYVAAYVRATGLYFGKDETKIMNTYRDSGLKHVGVNVDSEDALITGRIRKEHPRLSPAQRRPLIVEAIKKTLTTSVHRAIKRPYDHLVVLFHDINTVTADHLGDFITAIDAAVRSAPPAGSHVPEFASDRAKALAILDDALPKYSFP